MTLDNQRVHLLAVPGNFEFALVFSVGYSEERNRFEQLATLRCNQSSVMTKAELAEHLRVVAARLDKGQFRDETT
jgi:hypothetical protein